MDKELFEFQRNALSGKIAEPLCSEYKAAWRSCGDDKEKLVRLALKQQSTPYVSTACYRNLGVSKAYILNNFGEHINGRTFNDVEGVEGYTYQLWVGYDDDIEITSDVISLMWVESRVFVPEIKCPTLYLSNYSSVYLTLNGYNSVHIYLFDESKVVVDDADESCEVVVYKYSSKADVVIGNYCFGKVKIFNKQLKL